METEYFAGIDIGSTITKVVIMEEQIVASVLSATGPEHRKLANKVMEEALKQANLQFEQIKFIVATGYGRINVPFADKQITEISCHARGVNYFLPSVKTIIDIGGQDSKGIKLNNNRVTEFVMNDKCAAGTGRFLEVMARAMEVNLDEFGAMSIKSKQPSKISSLCTVFAESEVISLIAKGEQRQDIIAGIHESIAARVSSMVGRVGIKEPVMITGGVARNIGVVQALEKKLGMKIEVSPYAQVNGAIGAAILASSL